MEYHGIVNGTSSMLELIVDGAAVTGVIDIGGYRYELEGRQVEGDITGVMSDTVTGGRAPLAASMDETGVTVSEPMKARFHSPIGDSGEGATGPDAERLDPDLLGTWVFTGNIGIGVQRDRLVLDPDGAYTYLTRLDDEDEQVAGMGRWRTEGSVLHTDNGQGFQPYAQYQVQGPMLLMAYFHSNGDRRVWKKADYA